MKKFSFTINGNAYDLDIKSIEDNVAEVEVNGYSYTVEFDRVLETTKTPKLVRTEAIPSTDITRSEQKTSSPAGPKGSGFIKSPLPGTIIELHIKAGDTVRAGDKLLTLEAMKMENIINSDKSGTIISVNYKKGDAVMEGDILIEVG